MPFASYRNLLGAPLTLLAYISEVRGKHLDMFKDDAKKNLFFHFTYFTEFQSAAQMNKNRKYAKLFQRNGMAEESLFMKLATTAGRLQMMPSPVCDLPFPFQDTPWG